jgi:signal transduction histidine kinase
VRLPDFIEANLETILQAAEAIAATMGRAADHLTTEELRDHLPSILEAVVADLRTLQTAEQELDKSDGRAPLVENAPETAAQTHALLRAQGGFKIEHLVAEYRALRASVLRLWEANPRPFDAVAAGDITRFNEAIDQAVAESVAFFTAEVERWRHVFLGVLGHDLRGPLSAIVNTSMLLNRLASEKPVTEATQRLVRSGERMTRLLDDLLDYSRASLGLGIAILRAPVDLAFACEAELEVLRAALPGRDIGLIVEGTTKGHFDASRVREGLSNLVTNAAKYGTEGGPIRARLAGDARAVTLSVENEGPSIPAHALEALFEPLRRGADQSSGHASLGLGLFIVREIARAHGGDANASSREGKTVFTMMLPGGKEHEPARSIDAAR